LNRLVDQRRQLLDAAGRLFAERGVDAVSLRAVMAAAGTNVASVHYHFGSKEALVLALVRERSAQVAGRRAALLDAVETRPTLRGLAEAFVTPVAEVALGGQDAWVRLVDQIIATRHPALAALSDAFAPQGTRITAVFSRLCPEVPPATAAFRLSQAMTLTFRVLGDLDGARHTVALGGATLGPGQVAGELTDLVTAILAGPPGD
jgi:AcrR family transcriptional regulator